MSLFNAHGATSRALESVTAVKCRSSMVFVLVFTGNIEGASKNIIF